MVEGARLDDVQEARVPRRPGMAESDKRVTLDRHKLTEERTENCKYSWRGVRVVEGARLDDVQEARVPRRPGMAESGKCVTLDRRNCQIGKSAENSYFFGEVSEWLKEHAWKACMG